MMCLLVCLFVYTLRSVCVKRQSFACKPGLRHICRCLFSCLLTVTSSLTVQQGIDSEIPLWSPHVPPLNPLPLCLPPSFLSLNQWRLALSSHRYLKPSSVLPFAGVCACALLFVHMCVHVYLCVSYGLYWCWQVVLATLNVLPCSGVKCRGWQRSDTRGTFCVWVRLFEDFF